MSVMIRLARFGAKKKPFYRIVATDKARARNGLYLELLGTYDPKKNPGAQFKKDRIDYWLSQGASPSPRVAKICNL